MSFWTVTHQKSKVPPTKKQLLFPNSMNHQLTTAQSSTTHRVLDGASSSFEAAGRDVYCRTPQHFRKNLRPPGPSPHPRPPTATKTGVLSPSHSASTANLPRRWRLECDKSICPGLNLYANLK